MREESRPEGGRRCGLLRGNVCLGRRVNGRFGGSRLLLPQAAFGFRRRPTDRIRDGQGLGIGLDRLGRDRGGVLPVLLLALLLFGTYFRLGLAHLVQSALEDLFLGQGVGRGDRGQKEEGRKHEVKKSHDAVSFPRARRGLLSLPRNPPRVSPEPRRVSGVVFSGKNPSPYLQPRRPTPERARRGGRIRDGPESSAPARREGCPGSCCRWPG